MSSMRRRKERLAQRDDAIRRQIVSSVSQSDGDGDTAGTIEVAGNGETAAPAADVATSADAACARPKFSDARELPDNVATAGGRVAAMAKEGAFPAETPPRDATSRSTTGEGGLANKSAVTKACRVGVGGARRRRLEERMELREGMQPAARVVRVDQGGRVPPVLSSSSTSAVATSAASSGPIQSPGASSHTPETPEEPKERVAVAKSPSTCPSLRAPVLPCEEANHPSDIMRLDGDVAAPKAAVGADGGLTGAASDGHVSARPPPVVLRDSILERRPVPASEENGHRGEVGRGEGRRRQRQSKFKSSLARRHSPPSVVDRGVGGGFPSLDVPVGALALKGGKREQQRWDRVNGNSDAIVTNGSGGVDHGTTEASASPVERIDGDGSRGKNQNGNDGKRTTAPGVLHDQEEADEDRQSSADAVLEGMSNTEVVEAIEEIESSLSPDMIQFLRDRGRQKMAKKEKKQHQQELKCENPEERTNQSISTANEFCESGVIGNGDDSGNEQGAQDKKIPPYKYPDQPLDPTIAEEEKTENVPSGGTAPTERHLNVLANIRTTQELDEAFATLQPPSEGWKLKPFVEPQRWEEEHVRSAVTSASERKNARDRDAPSPVDELATATALLRSSALRQRLLGVKIVHRILEEEVKNSRGGAVGHAGVCEVPLGKAWPPLLPVALRCLLDTPSPRKHRLLHSYVLRCMYLLLVLFANPHHSMPGFHAEGDADGPTYQYQNWFMDDGVPTPPLGDSYARGRLTPSSLGVDDEKKDSKDSSMVACYATNSSAESAISDGSEFYKDPMWVLLSRMRFLPCVAALLASSIERSGNRMLRSSLSCRNAAAHPQGSHSVSRDVCGANNSEEWNEQGARMPDESFAAICGILSMMSVRSPGAACAIAEHESILPLIIEHALHPGADGWDDAVANVSPDVDASTRDTHTVGPCVDQAGDQSARANLANGNFVVDPVRARPALAFLCALARQSRRAAYSSPFETVMAYLHAILAMKAEHDEEWEVQKSALILWRTLLRYGFGLPYLSTFISLSASSIAVQASERSIAAEYLTCFSNVCECSRVVTQLKQSPMKPKVELTPEQRNTIRMAGMWLAPHVRQSSLLVNLELEACAQGSYSASTLKLAASRMRFIACYISAATPIAERSSSGGSGNAGEIKNDADDNSSGANFYPVLTAHESLASLLSVIESGMMEFALYTVLQQNPNVNSLYGKELDVEASACALVVAAVALLDAIGDVKDRNISSEDDGGAELEFAKVSSQLHRLVLKVLLAEVGSAARKLRTNSSAQEGDTHIARVGWLNAAHFAVVKLLCSQLSEIFVFDSNNAVNGSSTAPETNFGGSDIPDDLNLLKKQQRLCFHHFRQLTFSLLGKLQRGDEYIASVILRQNMLFALQQKDIIQEPNFPVDINSSTQKILLRELWKSEQSRNQFDHSCKLRGTGKVAVGQGPFALQSLRSDSESVAPSTPSSGKKDDDRTTDNLLPLGQMWLWHLLSGSVSPTHGEGVRLSQQERKRQASLEEAAKALAECLGLLHEMEFLSEESPCTDGKENRCYEASRGMFTGCLQSGAKLYHLCNICMMPEEVIRNDDVRRLFIPLFLFYSSSGQNPSVRTSLVRQNLVGSFVNACYLHSQISKSESHLDLRRRKEQRMLAFDSSDSSEAQLAHFTLSPDEEFRALDDFAGDMCDVFLEYGAQYEEYVYCIRFLLCHEIPPPVRSGIIRRLRDVLHLLTTDEEKCSPGGSSMAAALRQSLCGGLPCKDGSQRDSAEVLDAFAGALKVAESLAMPSRLNAADGGYAYLMAVACIGRNFASASQDGGRGIEAFRARLKGIESETLGHVVHVARRLLLSENGDKEALIGIVLDVCGKKEEQICDRDYPSLRKLDIEDDLAWKVVVNIMHSGITN